MCTSQDSWYTKKATKFTLTVHQNGDVTQNWQHSRSISSYLQIQPVVCSFISSKYISDQKETILGCVTELQLSNKKRIRCHPNYQGEGEWGDWILEQCSHSLKKRDGKMRAFLPDCHHQECPSCVMIMIVSIDMVLLNIPLLVVCNCCPQNELSVNYDLVF
jgi:hypothetical protein